VRGRPLAGRPHPDGARGGQAVDRLRFAVVTCSKYDNGFFNAYARIADADVDAVLHCGDYIYEGRTDSEAPPGRETSPPTEVRTLPEYRQRYAHYRSDPDLQRLHATHPMIATVGRPRVGQRQLGRRGSRARPRDRGRLVGAQGRRPAGLRRVAAAAPAGPGRPLAHLPPAGLRRPGRRRRARHPARGRSEQLSGLDGDQVIVDPAVADPARQLYSPVQRAWIEQSLAGSRAAWKLVLNQVLVSQLRAVGLPRAASDVLARLGSSMVPSEGVALAADIWDGYSAERDRLLGFLRAQRVQDVVVLTGDIHTSLANDLTEDPFDPLLAPAAVEFVTPSVTSSNFDEGLGVPPRTTSLAIEQTLRVQNPATKYVELDSNGYVLLDVTAERVQGEWWFVDTVRTPSSAQRLDATWQVRRGAQRLTPGGAATTAREQGAPPAAAPPPGAAPPSGAAPAAPGQGGSGAARRLPATGAAPLAAGAVAALAAGVLARRGAAPDRS
jgi:alkaline phosphatase D